MNSPASPESGREKIGVDTTSMSTFKAEKWLFRNACWIEDCHHQFLIGLHKTGRRLFAGAGIAYVILIFVYPMLYTNTPTLKEANEVCLNRILPDDKGLFAFNVEEHIKAKTFDETRARRPKPNSC